MAVEASAMMIEGSAMIVKGSVIVVGGSMMTAEGPRLHQGFIFLNTAGWTLNGRVSIVGIWAWT